MNETMMGFPLTYETRLNRLFETTIHEYRAKTVGYVSGWHPSRAAAREDLMQIIAADQGIAL